MRMFDHLFAPSAGKVFPPDRLSRIHDAIAEDERRHRGEICFAVESALHWRDVWAGVDSRQRAEDTFSRLRVWDTEANNGVLVYLLLADRAIEVVADRALHRRIAPADWQTLVEAMRGPLHEGRHEQALQTAVATLDGWLRQHFPADPSPARTRDNELPDPVELG